MHTLFLGNLPASITEASLRELFRRTRVDVISVEVRRGGIAFAHCPDQNSADRAIEVLNGYRFAGIPIRVEPSVPRHNRSAKVFVRQIPSDVDWEELDKKIAEFGQILSSDRGGSEETPTIIVTYKTFEQAEAAVEGLDKYEYHGHPLKVTIYHDRNRYMSRSYGNGGGVVGDRGYRSGSSGAGMGADRFMRRPNNAADMPLRMVVNSRLVGAIIGQGGANIRQITKDSKARCVVDVNHGIRDTAGNTEKVINIYGTPENASMACSKILEVVMREQEKEQSPPGKEDNHVEPELKLRAHNNLVGRLIGKAGSTIKKIMEETGCTVFVSNISELNAYNMERTITIRGPLEGIAQAEQRISNKLRQCWESDMANAPVTMYGGMHPLVAPQLGGPLGDPFGYSPNFQPGLVPGPHSAGVGRSGHMAAAPIHGTPSSGPMLPPGPMAAGSLIASAIETVHVWVPSNIVGALIGTKGSQIRNIIRMTGATIRIESTRNDNHEEDGAHEASPQPHPPGRRDMESERRVTIVGSDQQQYKAQFWVYQRVCEQGYHFLEEVRLCTEVQVPSKMVGRIIGKAGQNVRELQRVTGAQVKIPEDATDEETETTMVQIIGSFNASQAVQARIRQLVHQFHPQQGGGGRSLSSDRQRHHGRTPNHYSDDRD